MKVRKFRPKDVPGTLGIFVVVGVSRGHLHKGGWHKADKEIRKVPAKEEYAKGLYLCLGSQYQSPYLLS